jgi:hypothetical protein
MQARQALEEWRCDYNMVRPHLASAGLRQPPTPQHSHRLRAEALRSTTARALARGCSCMMLATARLSPQLDENLGQRQSCAINIWLPSAI